MRVVLLTLMAIGFLGGCSGSPKWKFWHSPLSAQIFEDPMSQEDDTVIYETVFPVDAGSWGGKVRAGPGTNYEHVASLKEGDPVVLLGVSDVVMNGYPWFHILYGSGQEGYKWGGILCATNEWVEGLYQRCAGSLVSNELVLRPDSSASAHNQVDLALKLLPGHWQSRSDPFSIMTFGHKRDTSDIHDGVAVTAGAWTVEESDISPTKVALRRIIDGHTDVYSVLFVSSDKMEISFLPRGLSLSYLRVK